MELHFLRLLRPLKKSKKKKRPGNVGPSWHLSLPTELLIMIVSHINNPQDLLSLCLVSRNLYNVSWAMLYKSVSTRLDLARRHFPGMVTLSVSGHLRLFQVLQIPRITGLVTDFRTHIAFCACSLQGGKTNCDAFDSLIGQVLEALENLRVLHFTCRCCYSRSSASRHGYLAKLKTRQMYELRFYCGCKLGSEARKSDFLAAPCMQGVTSLAIFNGIDSSNLAVLRRDDSLPQLKKLLCYDRRILDSLLSKGTVTHLVLDQPGWDEQRLLDSLRQHPGSLTHFNIANSDSYPAFLSISIDIFSRLQYIGRLHFNMPTFSSADRDDTIRWLRCFPRISTVQIWMDYSRHRFNTINYPGDGDLVRDLAQSIPGLRKVYVRILPPVARSDLNDSYRVWELHELQWSSRDVPEFTSWDIMHDHV